MVEWRGYRQHDRGQERKHCKEENTQERIDRTENVLEKLKAK